MMDKTININLAGTLFQIDEDAYRMLREYLQSINNHFRNVRGGLETIDDFESRIAEIFQSQKGLAGVITRENVEAMILIIGKPEDFDHSVDEPESPTYSAQRKRMYRNPDDSIISGVCGGIGAYLNSDPVLFRILFILFTVFFGVGFFVYIALWIALPQANIDSRKREMYGNEYHSARSQNRQAGAPDAAGAPLYTSGYNNTSRVGNAFNEVFRAIGRVCYIILRIFLIIIGILLMLTGFLAILSFVMIIVFKYPGAFSIDSSGFNLIYFPDFLNYIVSPSASPWIMILTSVAFILPMLALIYWGVKMIFWFNVKDGALSLAGLVLWVMSIAALALILFNEGISFAESSKTSSQIVFSDSPDTLYIITDRKIADLKIDKEISLKEEAYTVLINEEKKELYIRPQINVNSSEEGITRVEVRKRSSGRTELDALKKTEELVYNYSSNGDTLHLDEYFTIPSGRKWSADNVGINLYIPEGTILKFDSSSENMLHNHSGHDWESNKRLWVLSEDRLIPVKKPFTKQK
jgi:phage shock protein PspC (stress-responsive transcriptional regulator)